MTLRLYVAPCPIMTAESKEAEKKRDVNSNSHVRSKPRSLVCLAQGLRLRRAIQVGGREIAKSNLGYWLRTLHVVGEFSILRLLWYYCQSKSLRMIVNAIILQNYPLFGVSVPASINEIENVQRPRVCLWAKHEADFIPRREMRFLDAIMAV